MAMAGLLGTLSGLYCKISIVLFLLGILLFYRITKKNLEVKQINSKRYIIMIIFTYLIFYFQIIGLEKSFERTYQNVQGEIQVTGTILSNPIEKEYQTNYTVKVDKIEGKSFYQNRNILLKVKKQKNTKKYSYGNQIVFVGEWTEPSEARNEGGFDYKQYLKTKKIYGIIEAKQSSISIKKEENVNDILKLTNRIRSKIQEKANQLLEEKQASVLIALLIGNKDDLEEEVEEAFRTSNLSHMLAISGAHVSYVILLISFIIANSKVSKKVGKIVTILLLGFFLLLTGQTPSVTRACVMSMYWIIASLFHKRVSVYSSISISFLIILALNPYSILDIGMQLSYGGTIGIVTLYGILTNRWKDKKKSKIRKKIAEMVGLTLSANLMIFPITLYHFHTLSLTFLISNLLASPIMGILVILGFCTIFLSFLCYPIGNVLSYPLSILLHVFLQIAITTSKLPFSKINMAVPHLGFILLYYFLLFFFLCYQRKKEKIRKQMQKISKKKIVAVFLMIALGMGIYYQMPKQLKIHFIDVGQGDSMLILTPKGKRMLIDGGGQRDTKSFDVGKKTLLPYLLKKGITKLDYIVVSHFDSDHVRTDC